MCHALARQSQRTYKSTRTSGCREPSLPSSTCRYSTRMRSVALSIWHSTRSSLGSSRTTKVRRSIWATHRRIVTCQNRLVPWIRSVFKTLRRDTTNCQTRRGTFTARITVALATSLDSLLGSIPSGWSSSRVENTTTLTDCSKESRRSGSARLIILEMSKSSYRSSSWITLLF